MSKKKILLIIILIIIALVTAFVVYQYEKPEADNVMKGTHNILLLCADPSEQRPGIGGMDMAFAVQVVDGDVKNMTSIYPGGMMHPTAMEPVEISKGMLMLHDTLWDADPEVGAKLAQETVEYNTGIKTDAVVIVTPQLLMQLLQL